MEEERILNRKKFGGILAAFSLAAVCMASVQATPEISVVIDGEKLSFEQDQPPVLEKDRTLVPLRGIFEALGADVSWDAAAREVHAQKRGREIILKIGEKKMQVGDQTKVLDVPAKIIGERTMVPLRAVAEALDTEVEWDQQTYTAQITSPKTAHKVYDRYQKYSVTNEEGIEILRMNLAYPEFENPSQNLYLRQLNQHYADWDGIVEEFSKYREDAQQYYLECREEGKPFEPYTVEWVFDVPYNKESIIAVTERCRIQTEKNLVEQEFAQIYDLDWKEILNLDDLMRGPEEAIAEKIQEGFARQIQLQPENYKEDGMRLLEENIYTVSYYPAEDGIHFYFAPGILREGEKAEWTLVYAGNENFFKIDIPTGKWR